MTSTTHPTSAAGRSRRGQGPRRRLFARLGQIVTAHPGKVALGWLLTVGALIAVSSALGLLLMLRALLAPLYLMASVVAGFAASLGATVLVFQDVLGHQGTDFQLPMIVYLFVASIGTDYNILIISRLREEMERGATSREAARAAVRRAGPAVAAAGVVLATSFALLMISPLLADIGFAVAAGVLISAFINAFLLVPSLTVMAGRAAWWPSHPGAGRHSATAAADDLLPAQAPQAATATR